MMTDADKPAFAAALAALAALKPGAKLTTEQFVAWWDAMREDWTLEDFRHACATLTREFEFLPNPYHFAQLRKRATADNAGDAWARVREHARNLPVSGGFLQHVPIGDPFLDRVARAVGGYKAIAESSERDLQFIGQRFTEHFATMSESDEAIAALPGVESPREVRQMLADLTATKRVTS